MRPSSYMLTGISGSYTVLSVSIIRGRKSSAIVTLSRLVVSRRAVRREAYATRALRISRASDIRGHRKTRPACLDQEQAAVLRSKGHGTSGTRLRLLLAFYP